MVLDFGSNHLVFDVLGMVRYLLNILYYPLMSDDAMPNGFRNAETDI